MYSLKTVTGEYLWKSKRKTFIIGLATAVKSKLAIAKDLLANHSFKFILTYKFSQDAIEIFFVLCGANLVIIITQIVWSSKML